MLSFPSSLRDSHRQRIGLRHPLHLCLSQPLLNFSECVKYAHPQPHSVRVCNFQSLRVPLAEGINHRYLHCHCLRLPLAVRLLHRVLLLVHLCLNYCLRHWLCCPFAIVPAWVLLPRQCGGSKGVVSWGHLWQLLLAHHSGLQRSLPSGVLLPRRFHQPHSLCLCLGDASLPGWECSTLALRNVHVCLFGLAGNKRDGRVHFGGFGRKLLHSY